MSINIRRMHNKDIDAVYAIETEVHLAPWTRGILKECVLVGYDCRVLEVDYGESFLLGGYLIARQSNNNYHILNYAVAKTLQQQGYGRLLLQTVIDSLSPSEIIQSITLEVRLSNQIAIHLYETMGFQRTSIKQGYYNEGPDTEDAIVLELLLKP